MLAFACLLGLVVFPVASYNDRLSESLDPITRETEKLPSLHGASTVTNRTAWCYDMHEAMDIVRILFNTV
jgi:hypothetical protein